MVLTDRDKAILDFERSWWTERGPKEVAIRERFDLSPTRYYQIVISPPQGRTGPPVEGTLSVEVRSTTRRID